MLYFMLTRMCAVDHMYQYSLDSFVTFFLKSIAKATAAPKIEDRVANLVTSLRMTIFTWVAHQASRVGWWFAMGRESSNRLGTKATSFIRTKILKIWVRCCSMSTVTGILTCTW